MKNFQKMKRKLKERRHKRVRAKIKGTKECPRLSVFRSLKHIYAQLIDDVGGYTLVSASDLEFKKTARNKKEKRKTIKAAPSLKGKLASAYEVGKTIAQRALEKGIEKVIFDKGSYKYHGRVKALADGAREGGLKF